MGNIADLTVGLRADSTKLPADLAAGESKLAQFAKSAEGHGATAGRGLGKGMDRAGIEAANGWVRGADGRLRDSGGRFVSAGEQAAAGLDAGLSRGFGKTEGKIGAFVSRWTKRLAVGLGAGALIFGQTAVTAEASFSQTMNTISAATGAVGKDFQKLSQLALDMGAKTSFSASDAADAMLELAKSGLGPATIQAGALEGTLTLAAAGGTTMGTAATIAANAMNAFSLKGNEMNSVAAAIAGGANASSASVESLGQALSQVGPGAVNAGLSLQQTVGVLSAFDAAGVKGSDAGTSLKTMLARLVPTTKAASQEMRALGIDFTKADGSFKSISTVSQILQDKLGGLSDAERTVALNRIFGSDASRAATVLMKEGAAGVQEYIKATRDQGAAQKMADARMKGTAGAIENFKGALETAQIELGLLAKPHVEKALSKLTGLVNGAVPAMKSFVGEMRSGTGAGGAFATALTTTGQALVTIASAGASVLGFFAQHRTTAAALAVTMGALLLVTKAHAAAMALSAAGGLAAWLKGTTLITNVTKVWTAVQWALNAAILANPIVLIIAGLAALAVGLVVAYKKSATFRNIVQGALGGVKAAASAVAGFFTNKIPAAFNKVTGAASKVLGWVKGNWPTILAVLTGPFGLAVLAITKNWDKITAGGRKVLDFVKTIPSKITGALGNAGSLLLNAGRDIIDGLIRGITEKVGALKDKLSSVTKIIPDFKGPKEKDRKLLTPAGRMIMQGLIAGITAGEPALKSRLGRVTKAIDQALAGKEITKNAAKRMRATVDGVGKQLDRLVARYNSAVGDLKSKVDARAQMSAGIASALAGELDLGSLVTTTEPNQYGYGGGQTSASFASIAGAVSGLAARAKAFAGKLRALLKAGIPKGLVQEVAGLGTVQGTAVANALLSGSKTQVRSLASDYAAIATNSKTAGDVVAGSFYDTGIAAQQGLIKGLLKDDTLTKAANTLATKLTKKIRKALGIKSPSRVMAAQVGAPMVDGVAAGYLDAADAAGRVMSARTAALVKAPAAVGTATTGVPEPQVLQWLLAALVEALKNLRVQVDVGLDRPTQARIVQTGTTELEKRA